MREYVGKKNAQKIKHKGQGALEYLLLIGGAVLVAVIVITLLLGLIGEITPDKKFQINNPVGKGVWECLEETENIFIDSDTVHCEGSGDHRACGGKLITEKKCVKWQWVLTEDKAVIEDG